MTVRDRYEGVQTLFREMGSEGCHFLVLCSIAEESIGKPIDIIDALRVSLSKGWMRKDYWVNNDGTPLLNYLTGLKWTRKEVVKLPVIRDNDYTESVWYNPNTQYHHYRRRYFDTLDHSYTVEKGYIEKYYIYTVGAA